MRLFTAVELTAPTRVLIASFGERLCAGVGAGVRRVPSENLHVTVHFLGSVPATTLSRVLAALDAATEHVPPGVVDLRGVGAFPKASRPSVIWTGVDDSEGILDQVHHAVTTALAPLGYPAEERPYRPHVTVARVSSERVSSERVSSERGNSERGNSGRGPRARRAPAQLIERLQALLQEPAPAWGRLPVDHLTVFRSTFATDTTVRQPASSGSGGPGGRGGPRYERVARFALRGHAGEDSRVATGSDTAVNPLKRRSAAGNPLKRRSAAGPAPEVSSEDETRRSGDERW